MLRKRTQLILLLLAFSPWFLHAQCTTKYADFLNGNKVNAELSNGADHFWDFNATGSYEVPAGSNVNSMFASSLWIGGLDFTSQLHVSANTYRQTGTDFYTGPFRTTGNYTCGRGFIANGSVFDRGFIPLLSGSIMATYPNGFTVYDPTSATSNDYILPQTRNNYDVFELADGRILLYGDDNYPTLNDAMIIDTSSFTATSIGQLNYFHRWSSATRLLNGQVLLAGVLGCEIFDPVSSTSTAVATMGRMRVKHAATLLPNGNVLVVGGGSQLGGTGATPTTEIYNPAANTWTNGPGMNSARNSPEITEMSNGNFLISGGATSITVFDIYDPIANTMTPIPGADYAFNEHSTIPLTSGEILFTTNGTSSSSWLYRDARIFRYDPVTQTRSSMNFIGTNSLAARVASGNVMMEFNENEFVELNPTLGAIEEQPWQRIWKVSSSQVSQFITDWQNNQVNFANYPDIEYWPANGDTSLGEDLHLAPFVDVNMDGRYRPLQDGDYPCIEGDQALWWVYNDDGPHGETNGQKMGIQVESMAYAYDCNATQCPDSFLDYTTLYHHEITNKSENDYTEVYVGLWMDVDLGNFWDDFIGSDSALSLGYVYNGDNDDESVGAPNYGLNPPALGMVVLDNGDIQGATNFMSYNNDFTVTGNPDMPVHYYNYLRSRWKDGSHLVNNGGNGYSGSQAGPDIDWFYPGDGGFCGPTISGWSEVSAGNTPSDRRGIVSVGPFDLDAGEKIEFDFALVWARGADYLNSVCRLKSSTASIKTWWENQSHGCFDIVLSEDPPELSTANVQLYPNPNSGSFRIELDKASMTDAALSIYDISGRQVHQEVIPAQIRSLTVSQPNLSEGIYLVHIQMTDYAITKKLVVRH